MWEVGLLPSPVEFSSHCHFYKLSHSWLLGMCCHSCLLQTAFYLQFREGFPLPSFQCSGCPTLFAMCLLLLLIIQFLFFPWVCFGLSSGLC
jgi:hypothetical protein